MKFEIAITFNKNSISAKIISSELFDIDTEYYFYLIKDGVVISRCGWLKENHISWNELSSGKYQVRGFCKLREMKEDKFSDILMVYDESIDDRWNRIVSNGLSIPKLKFSPSSFPHQDILLYQGERGNNFEMLGFSNRVIEFDKKTVIIFNNSDIKGNGVIFSGSAFFNDDLIFGQSDANCVIAQKDLVDSTGDFSAILELEKSVIVTNDYFGVQKLFFYKSGEDFFVSNRVHLLLLAMISKGVEFEIDPDVFKAVLASGYIQPFQQIFTSNLMIKGVKILPIDHRFIIDDMGVHMEPKLISDILSNNLSPLREGEYEDIFDKGVADIKRQAAAVLKHPYFDNVVVDATGGMDSRVVLAAIASENKNNHKVSVNAMDTPSIPLDIKVACTLSNILGLKHNKTPEIAMRHNKNHHKLSAISQLLGVYFAYNIENRGKDLIRAEKSIGVTGFFGEICLRPYYSRPYLNNFSNGDFSNEGGLRFNDFLLSENRSGMLNSEARNIFHVMWENELESLPGGSAVEKYDLHYLYYRNGLHCSDIFRFKWDNPRVGIIQSKNLFFLKRKIYNRAPVTFLQNNVIARLFPDALSVPYASERDNEDLLKSIPFWENKIEKKIQFQAVELVGGEAAVNARKSIKTEVIYVDDEKDDSVSLLDLAEMAVVFFVDTANIIDYEFGKELMLSIRAEDQSHIIVNKIIMAYYMYELSSMKTGDVNHIISTFH